MVQPGGYMDSITKLRKLLLYAGLEKEEYDKLRPRIREENGALLKIFSLLSAVIFLLLLIASLITTGFATVNSSTYLVSGTVMLIILFFVKYLIPKNPEIVMFLVYVFDTVLYAFGIYISMLHAEKPAVSAVAFLLVAPLIFYDRPIRMIASIVIVVVVICGVVCLFKEPDIAEGDVWNAVAFGVVGIAITLFITSIKIRSLAQSIRIDYLSQTDLLTGVKNRNNYESRLRLYPEMCETNLICVYADVNGLHEMNNREGHQAGDRMLREVAKKMQQYFGAEHTYRIGGDEFVSFKADGQPESVVLEIGRISRELAGENYFVSFGTAVRDKGPEGVDITELVKEAENNMFDAKREFYRNPKFNRRNR